jgi:hypothetical protein
LNPRQSIRIRGGDLDSHLEIFAPYEAVGSYRRALYEIDNIFACGRCGQDGYDAATNGTPIIRIQAEVRLDGPSIPNRDIFSASIAAIALGSSAVGELIIDADGYVHGYSGNDKSGTQLPKVSVQTTLGDWHQLAIDVNFAARTYTFFVDGSSLGGAFTFDAEVGDTNVLRRGSMVTYARPDGAGFLRNNYVVHFDNFSITAQ